MKNGGGIQDDGGGGWMTRWFEGQVKTPNAAQNDYIQIPDTLRLPE